MGWIDMNGSRIGKVQVTEECMVGFKYMVYFKVRSACCAVLIFSVQKVTVGVGATFLCL